MPADTYYSPEKVHKFLEAKLPHNLSYGCSMAARMGVDQELLPLVLAALKVLAKDEDPQFREEVAEHPNTPVDFLEELAKDEDSSVRQVVA